MLDTQSFDENTITWHRLPDVEHVWLSILDVDETAKIVDVLFRFAANEKIVLHRHVAAFHTFVVKGEHRIYTPEGELKEVRSAGTYRAGKADPEPHTEGVGTQMCSSSSVCDPIARAPSTRSSMIVAKSSTP